MHAWRTVIGSAALSVVALAVLAELGGTAVVPAVAVLAVALAMLARSAIRLAGEPPRRDAPPPRGRG
jgi:membrane protein implicated in regulation of membrane protease activity